MLESDVSSEAEPEQEQQIALTEEYVTLLDNGFTKIPSLQVNKACLRSLSLSSQSITKIEDLNGFANLKDLFLYNNKISRIENLQGCPKLQRLWLFSNQICHIENLELNTNLKELWLQQNFIESIPNLSYLTKLESLRLSSNKISEIRLIEKLTELPSLIELSFEDNDFSGCPIVQTDNYRNLMIFHLTQLQILDGTVINDNDRSQVNDIYQQMIRSFNIKLDLLKKQSKDQVKTIQARKQDLDYKANIIKKQLLDSFSQLESLVSENRTRIIKEQIQQIQSRQQKKEELEKTLESLRKKYATEIELYINKENQKLKNHNQFFQSLQKQTEMEIDEDIFIEKLSQTQNGKVIAFALNASLPEYRFVKTYFQEQSDNLFKILKLYKIFNLKMQKGFDRTIGKNNFTKNIKRLFYCNNVSVLHGIIQNGFHKESTPLIFYENLPESTNILNACLMCQVLETKIFTIKDVLYTPQNMASILKKSPSDCHGCVVENIQGQKIYLINSVDVILSDYFILFTSSSLFMPRGKIIDQLQQLSNVTILYVIQLTFPQEHTSHYPSLLQLEKKAEEHIRNLKIT